MVNHVESQKRLIERLEDDVEVIVQQHQHFMDQLKVKQVNIHSLEPSTYEIYIHLSSTYKITFR